MTDETKLNISKYQATNLCSKMVLLKTQFDRLFGIFVCFGEEKEFSLKHELQIRHRRQSSLFLCSFFSKHFRPLYYFPVFNVQL